MGGRDDELAPVPPAETLLQRIERELGFGCDYLIAVRAERLVGMLALRPADGTLDQIFVMPRRTLLAEARRRLPAGFRLRMASGNARSGLLCSSGPADGRDWQASGQRTGGYL